MSFLNPVNEPVKHFKSTDTGAPQINYAARTAGDVKAVLKACLVTGYGSVASAGWSITGETANTAEFYKDSASMSSYKLCINDDAASQTLWSYKINDVGVAIPNNAAKRSVNYINTAHADNAWHLLVAARAVIYIEVFQHSRLAKTLGRIVYFGQIKGCVNNTGDNIAMWCNGYGFALDNRQFFTPLEHRTSVMFNNSTTLTWSSVIIDLLQSPHAGLFDISGLAVNIDTPLYFRQGAKIVAEQPALQIRLSADPVEKWGVRPVKIEGRDALYVPTTFEYDTTDVLRNYFRPFVIFLDYWGF